MAFKQFNYVGAIGGYFGKFFNELINTFVRKTQYSRLTMHIGLCSRGRSITASRSLAL